MKKILFSLIVAFSLLCAKPTESHAQCAMCRAAPGSNLAAGGKDGAGLNKGIFYMFLGPYCIVGVMGYLWWRGRKQYIAQEQENETRGAQTGVGEEV
jgi:hypothetical protein